MNTQREARRIRLPQTRTTWENQSSSEVAAGKLEVMEKFFTPLPHSTGHKAAKSRTKEASWEGNSDQYCKESMSSSSASTSSSPWSSESNFRAQEQFAGYNSRAPHSRSCNDLCLTKSRENENKRDFTVKYKESSHIRKADRDSSGHVSPVACRAGSTKMKSHSGHRKNVEVNSRSEREDKIGGRRARSMEALAQKETKNRQGKTRRDVIEEKQKFSRFLDEITIQVLSPSNLDSLGVKERQSAGSKEQWKNSSTDSSGSRSKISQHNSAADKQDVRRKGKGKTVSATTAKMGVDSARHPRSRDMSTSPDSLSSSNWHRGDGEHTNVSPSGVSHQSRTRQRLTQQRETKEVNPFEQMVKEKKEAAAGGGTILKGKTRYVDTAQSSDTSIHLIPPPPWWGDPGDSVLSQQSEGKMEKHTDLPRRMKDRFSGIQSNNQSQDSTLQSATLSENLEQDKDSLNVKITELLDHLVRAQSTICALEKLNVSTLLRHLPADMLESVQVTYEGLGGNVQPEKTQDLKVSNANTSKASQEDTCDDGDLIYPREKTEGQSAPRLTAFTPWSPRRQRSFPVLHTLYTSTESECSLEDMLPTCKLLPPRFPNLGESFSDDQKDEGKSGIYETRPEQKSSGAFNTPLTYSNLLPTHHIPRRHHHSRASSSESSGDDPLITWGEMPPQESSLDYHSAQKILDTLLGLTTPVDRMNVTKPEDGGGFSFGDVRNIDGQAVRRDIPHSINTKGPVSTTDGKHVSYATMNKDDLHNFEQQSQNENILCSAHSPLCNPTATNHNLTHMVSRTPPLPAKRSGFPGTFSNTCPLLSPVGEVGFHPLHKSEASSCHKSECILPPSSLPIPSHAADPLSQHSIPFVLRSPSGTESIVGRWEGHTQVQEGIRERKPRKERTVTFNTMHNDRQLQTGQVTGRSKFKPNRVGNQDEEDNISVDSTLL